ncbi:YhgE/Pip domain-containing protein [Furfurilactobacillus milii]|uniref:YhgE/Pip domain-containing protein n=1 Tax=Furfurilactobacillus milii TaxID=2888272 RepID=A0ABT6DAJ2_9LACO|nr:YhgE/Pip domain-containing protein [Furfurilactobacillus milii]QLE65749.1 hypothetical protein LROSL2_0396 [Furfurilactobacillus rossiae]MCF6160340.1 YhgE/Pip domain-containing protein [Furfurilactobacillus milii]MCF6162283.1 YhgE/Pip domain-containing protein [Furfurilactobacillus milii]MDF9913302.1 YhgE/Pip domain-containing protein [Furfurilactobacillus milii]QLE68179.1 hypothetical protein LROSL3_0397 [Furfurilactobacillus rossiae]
MIANEWKFIGKNRLILISVLAIMIIPFLYSIFFLKSVWNPYGETQHLPVAVVNNDQPVKYQGQTMNVGDQAIKSLKKDHQLGWRFVSEKKAKQGLKDKKYYTIVTFPKDTSKNAASVLSKNPKKMDIQYETNGSLNYIGEVISKIGATGLNEKIRQTIIKAYADATFQQVKKVGKGMNTAAKGAKTLSKGQKTLGTGIDTYTAYVSQVNDGVQTMKMSVGPLSSGVGKLADGGKTLNNGLQTLNGSTGQLAGGVNQLASGSGQLASGVQTYTNGVGTLNSGIQTLNGSTGQLAGGVGQLAGGSSALANGVQTYTNGVGQLAGGSGQLASGLQTYTNGVGSLNSGIQELNGKTSQLAGGVGQLNTGSKDLLTKTQELSTGVAALGSNVGQVNSGLDNLTNQLTQAQGLMDGMSDRVQTVSQIQALQSQLKNSGLDTALNDLQPLIKLAPQLPAMKQQASQISGMADQLSKAQAGANAIKDGNSSAVTALNGLADSQSDANLKAQLQGIAKGLQQSAEGAGSLSDQLGTAGGQLTNVKSLADELGQINLSDADIKTLSSLSDLQKQLATIEGSKTLATLQSPQTQAALDSMPKTINAALAKGGQIDQLRLFANSVGQLNSKVNPTDGSTTLVQGVSQLSDGLGQLNGQIPALTGGVSQLANGSSQLSNNSAALVNGANQINGGLGQLNANSGSLVSGANQLNGGLGQLNSQIPTLTNGVQQLANGSSQLNANSGALVSGANQLNGGIGQLNAQVPQLVGGVQQLANGSYQLSGGLDQLNSQIPALTDGVNQLADGTSQLNSNSPALKDGTKKLVTGSVKLSDALGKGADQVNAMPLTSKTSDMFSAPTKLTHKSYSKVANYGHALAPYVLSVALYVGAIVFNFAYPIRKVSMSGQSATAWFFSKTTIGLVVAVVQAVAETGLMMLFGLSADHPGQMFAVSISFSIASMFLVMFLSMLLDNPGRFIAMVLLMLQLGGSGGTFPMQVTNGFYNAIHPYLPMTYSILGLRQGLTSGLGNDTVTQAVGLLLLMAVIFAFLLWLSMLLLQRMHLQGFSQLDDNQKLQDVEK